MLATRWRFPLAPASGPGSAAAPAAGPRWPRLVMGLGCAFKRTPSTIVEPVRERRGCAGGPVGRAAFDTGRGGPWKLPAQLAGLGGGGWTDRSWDFVTAAMALPSAALGRGDEGHGAGREIVPMVEEEGWGVLVSKCEKRRNGTGLLSRNWGGACEIVANPCWKLREGRAPGGDAHLRALREGHWPTGVKRGGKVGEGRWKPAEGGEPLPVEWGGTAPAAPAKGVGLDVGLFTCSGQLGTAGGLELSRRPCIGSTAGTWCDLGRAGQKAS